jgi:SAM-dependent methyltransferase
MRSPNKLDGARTHSKAGGPPWPIAQGQRPSFRLSDVWKAPLHDFPIRDEILYQCLPLTADLDVLEIGPGSGFTSFRMAREVRNVSVLDVSAETIHQLESSLQDVPNLSFFCADLCAPGLKSLIKKEFNAVFALAVLDLLPDPAAGLKNLAEVLQRGGRLALQFPNYPPPKARGITFFKTRRELDGLLQAAGFESWNVFALRLRSHASFIFEQFHERPLRAARWLRGHNSNQTPLTYEATWAFRNSKRLEILKYLMHMGWVACLGAVHAGGDAFELLPLSEEILNHNLLLLAQR